MTAKLPDHAGETLRFYRNVALLLVGWGVLIGVNRWMVSHFAVDTSRWFPISIFRGPELHVTGALFAPVFGLLLVIVLRRRRWPVAGLWAVGLALLVTGNLMQGGPAEGFLTALTGPEGDRGTQYFHEAVRVTDPAAWLAGFNRIQATLNTHARTHPPFAVLIERVLLPVGGVPAVATAFVLAASLLPLLVFALLRELGVERERAVGMGLLFALIPAYNIYGAVSLDAVIAIPMTVALWGLCRVMTRGGGPAGHALFVAGAVGTNLITFGGTFLLATAGLLGLHEWVRNRRPHVLVATGLAVVALGAAIAVLKGWTGYDHLAAFLTASRLENPHGFQLLFWPSNYLATRAEGVAEILLFFSLGALAVLPVRRILRTGLADPRFRVGLCGVATLGVMFLTGAFRTGETARACLYIYPYLTLFLADLPDRWLARVTALAGIQTGAMQLTGSYFW